MKKRFLAAVLAVAMLATLCAGLIASASDEATAPSSEVINSSANLMKAIGDFEAGTVGELPTGFYLFTDGPCGKITTEAAHSGEKCVSIPGGWAQAMYTSDFELDDGHYYKFSFWAFTVNTPGKGNTTLSLKVNNADIRPVGDERESGELWYSGAEDGVWIGKNVNKWLYIERTIFVKNGGAVGMTLNAESKTYYDDFCLIDLGEALPTPEVTLEPTAAPTTAAPVATAAPTTTAATTATPATSPSASPTEPTVTKKKVTIKFAKKAAKIKKGKQVTLKVSLKNAKKATFATSNKKVAKIAKKAAKAVTIKGLKKGKAVITAKAGGKKATCKVTVK